MPEVIRITAEEWRKDNAEFLWRTAVETGINWERAKIVNWLKSLATPENGFLPRTLANWIEDEMHYEGD